MRLGNGSERTDGFVGGSYIDRWGSGVFKLKLRTASSLSIPSENSTAFDVLVNHFHDRRMLSLGLCVLALLDSMSCCISNGPSTDMVQPIYDTFIEHKRKLADNTMNEKQLTRTISVYGPYSLLQSVRFCKAPQGIPVTWIRRGGVQSNAERIQDHASCVV